jgi:hypothetical protein
MNIDPKVIMETFNPIYDVMDLGLKITKDNFPENLIHDHCINDENCDVRFYQVFWSDTTYSFFVDEAIKRIKSLVSRATHHPESDWLHSDIINIFHDDDPKANGHPDWMTKSTSIVYVKERKRS